MSLIFFHNPFSKMSREVLYQLQSAKGSFVVQVRKSPNDDQGFWIGFLPTILAVNDSDKKEIARIERASEMNIENLQLLWKIHDEVKAGKPVAAIPSRWSMTPRHQPLQK